MASDDIYPLHKINRGGTGAVPVEIGDVKLGEDRFEHQHGTQPNPVKVTWSSTNEVAVHKIPYPKHKTIRSSKKSLFTLQLTFKTFRIEIFRKVLALCKMCGPHWVKTATEPSPLWMYITDYSFEESEAKDDDYVEWNLTLIEVND